MDQTKSLNEAMAAIRLGDLLKGKQLLTRVLNRDPKNETALLWMTQVVTDDQRRIDYLNRVLEVNPANKQAQERPRLGDCYLNCGVSCLTMLETLRRTI